MTLRKAIKTGLPIRRKGKKSWSIKWDPFLPASIIHGWVDPEFFLSVVHLTIEDVLAKDWQVKKAKK